MLQCLWFHNIAVISQLKYTLICCGCFSVPNREGYQRPSNTRAFFWSLWQMAHLLRRQCKQPVCLGCWNIRQEKSHSSDNSVIGHSPVCHFTLPWTKNSLTSQHALPFFYLQQIHNNETGDFHAAVRNDLISALGDWLQLALPHLIINLCHH